MSIVVIIYIMKCGDGDMKIILMYLYFINDVKEIIMMLFYKN